MELYRSLVFIALRTILNSSLMTQKVRDLLMMEFNDLTVTVKYDYLKQHGWSGQYRSAMHEIILLPSFEKGTTLHELGHWITDIMSSDRIDVTADKMVHEFKHMGISLQLLHDNVSGYHARVDYHKVNSMELIACAFDAQFSDTGNKYTEMIVCYFINRNRCAKLAAELRPDNYRDLRKEEVYLCANQSYKIDWSDDNNSRWWDTRYRINGKKR